MTQPADDIRYLWQKMPTDTLAISTEEMRKRSQKFQGRVRLRNFIEYGAFVFIVLGFGFFAIKATTWQGKAACIFMIACSAVSVFNLYRLGRAGSTPKDASAAGLIDFQRSELMRQRDALVTVWRWYIMPFVPGLIFFCVIGWMGLLGNGVPLEHGRKGVIMVAILFTAISTFGILLNLLGAAHLQRRIEDLDRYKEKA